jgi:taurine dioxygenase
MEVIHSSAPIGSEIRKVDLSQELDAATFDRIFSALNERSVLVFRDQRIRPEHLVRFSQRLGPLTKPALLDDYALPEAPEVLKVSNIVENGKHIGNPDAGLFWHSDGAYSAKPHMYSILYSIEVPQRDGQTFGDTLYTSTAAAYDALSPQKRACIDRLRAIHSLNHQYEQKKSTGFLKRSDMSDQDKSKVVPPVVHPLVRQHPHTGRGCIFVNEGHTCGIEGMAEHEARELLQQLFAHCTSPQFIYRHQWRVGDLVVWDNCATQHKATFDYALPLRRLMYRTTVTGEKPFGLEAKAA